MLPAPLTIDARQQALVIVLCHAMIATPSAITMLFWRHGVLQRLVTDVLGGC